MARRTYAVYKYHMGRWVHRRLMRTVETLMHDGVYVDGKGRGYGIGGVATDVVVKTGRVQRRAAQGEGAARLPVLLRPVLVTKRRANSEVLSSYRC